MKKTLAPIAAAISASFGVLRSAATRVGESIDKALHRKLGSARKAGRVKRWAAGLGAALALASAGMAPGVAQAMATNLWSNTQIDVETASTALTVTAITRASTGVVSYTGTDPANGDYVKFTDMVGMIELNDQVFRIANVNAGSNTFELEDINTSNFGVFVSGTMHVVTFGVSMTTVQSVNSGGGEFQFADLTTIHDTLQKRAPTTASPFTMQLGCIFKPGDPAHVALEAANDTKAVKAIRVRWATGDVAAWLAYVGAAGIPTGQAQGVVTTAVNFEGQGKPRFWGA
jgi:hypothetical protein